MKRLLGALVVASFASVLAAADEAPSRKTWAASPEAYFLTTEERAAWKNVGTDEQAREFVARYMADRGADFEPMLRERIGVADKYFSSGKKRGSETLRGKVIILFGPPSRLSTKNGRENMGSTNSDRAEVAGGVADPHSNVGPGVRGLAQTAQDPVFTVEYDQSHAPKAIGAFQVELKMKSDTKQEPIDTKDLEEKFEAVARASRVRPQ